MSSIGEIVLERVQRDDALPLLKKYYSGANYTGSLYDELGSVDPYRITSEDIAAVACLSVPLSGPAVSALLRGHAAEIGDLLRNLPPGADLAAVESEDELEPLWALQAYFRDHVRNVDIGHVRRSKLLAHKRPHLIPIRDQHVLRALVGGTTKPLTKPLWEAFRWDGGSVVERLQRLRADARLGHLSVLRVLDVAVWMQEWGDGQVDAPLRPAT